MAFNRLLQSFDAQITAADFSEELRNNPVLAAALVLPNGSEDDAAAQQAGPGACALREIYRCRRLRHDYEARRRSGSSSIGSAKHHVAGREGAPAGATSQAALDGHEAERRKQEEEHQAEVATISWTEFVGAFLPLGRWVPAEDSAEQGDHWRGTEKGKNGHRVRGGVGKQTGEGGLVDKDEMQLLRVAFALAAVGTSRGPGGEADAGALVSLAELRAASALLDGEEPPEGPIRKALEVKREP